MKYEEEEFIEAEGTEEVVSEEAGAGEALKKLRDKLKLCQAEKQEYLDASQRLRADYANLKRTSEQAAEKLAKFANEKLLLDFISVMDGFDQALSLADTDETWREGIQNLANKMQGIFQRHGLEAINPIGQTFDPNLAQAIANIDTNKAEEDNLVLEVIQKGYQLHHKVIRPAMVKVGHKI